MDKINVAILNCYSKACKITDFKDMSMKHVIQSVDYQYFREQEMHLVAALVTVECKENQQKKTFHDTMVFRQEKEGKYFISSHIRRSITAESE